MVCFILPSIFRSNIKWSFNACYRCFGRSVRKNERGFDYILFDAFVDAGKGYLFGKLFDSLCTFDFIGNSYNQYASNSSKWLNQIHKGKGFSQKRDAFYRYMLNDLSANAVSTVVPESLVNTIYFVYGVYKSIMSLLS